MIRQFVKVFGTLALGLSCVGCQQEIPPCGDAWCTSWSEFATAVDSLRAEAEKESPESPDFPMAGMKMRVGGEELPTDWPVMTRFRRMVSFEGRFKSLETPSDDSLPNHPFMIALEMPKTSVEGFAVALIYPRADAVDRWRAVKSGDNVRFRAAISGIAASDASAGTLGLLLNVADQQSKRYLRESQQNSFIYKRGPYIYYVTMTNAEPLAE